MRGDEMSFANTFKALSDPIRREILTLADCKIKLDK